jgi:hypothetical protein
MKKNRGFTLLISVLIASIMFSISLGISSIIRGEIFLANTGRQSQMAYYAADAGIECAIYWDTLHNDGDYDNNDASPFATSTPDNVGTGIDCGDDDFNNEFDVGERKSCVNSLDGSGSFSPCVGDSDKKAGVNNFVIRFENGSCAKVKVIKRQYYEPLDYYPPAGGDPPPDDAVIETFIRADGRSSGDANCDSTSSRVFERSIEAITYE